MGARPEWASRSRDRRRVQYRGANVASHSAVTSSRSAVDAGGSWRSAMPRILDGARRPALGVCRMPPPATVGRASQFSRVARNLVEEREDAGELLGITSVGITGKAGVGWSPFEAARRASWASSIPASSRLRSVDHSGRLVASAAGAALHRERGGQLVELAKLQVAAVEQGGARR